MGRSFGSSSRIPSPTKTNKVDDQPLSGPSDLVYYALQAARLYHQSSDPEGRRSVVELFQHLPIRVEPVGRLDMDRGIYF